MTVASDGVAREKKSVDSFKTCNRRLVYVHLCSIYSMSELIKSEVELLRDGV